MAESDQNAIGRVCAIFEKLNSTGVELSVYDLLTARLYRSGVRLHELWENACRKNSRFADWSEGKAEGNKFGVLTLRTLALLRGLDPKPRNLINLDASSFARDWDRAAAAMERALELLTNTGANGFGVFDRKWIPGFGLVPILAALRAEIDDRDLGNDARAALRRWYWCNVFLERYSSAVESKSRKDYAEMLSFWTQNGPEPAVFSEARARLAGDGFTIRDSASYASAVYCGVFCRLAQRGAKDWKRGETIDLQKLQDHHIFPQAYLKRHGLAGRRVNTVVNRTLISDKTNNGIKDRAPEDYLSNPDLVLSDRDPSFFQSHFLSPEAVAILGSATEKLTDVDAQKVYDDFPAAREAAILREIRSICFDTSAAVA